MHDAIRRWSDRPLHTAIYTHGHLDHVMALRADVYRRRATRERSLMANGIFRAIEWIYPRVRLG